MATLSSIEYRNNDSDIPMTKEENQISKIESQIRKQLSKIESIRTKLNDSSLHSIEKESFEILLSKVTNSQANKQTIKSLRQELKEIKKIFTSTQKLWKAEVKQQKSIKKEERKQIKEQKKQIKLEFIKKLEDARINKLPQKINNYNNLELWIDGWNISGCFGGRSRSKTKLIKLLQNFYDKFGENNNNNNNNENENDEKYEYNLTNIQLFYDGNGKDKLIDNVNVQYSGKDIIVDDLWVNLLSKYESKNKENIICVTSDRELTTRLYDIGITVMKSGTFYKQYLKIPENNENNENNGNYNEDQKEDINMN